MPDANDRIDTPGDWQRVLAALPLESPPPGGWNRIAGQLPRAHRRRWPVAMATAATLAVIAFVPALWRHMSVPVPAAPVAVTPGPMPANPQPSPSTASKAPDAAAGETSASPRLAGTTGTGDDSEAADTTVDATTKTARSPAQRSVPDTAADTVLAASAPTTPAAEPSLESLYVESAHLESLLAQMQDERVANGPAMAMAEALQDRIAAIDHALSQPGSDGEQHALWQQRVQALRRLAGLEGTQRWLAARGNTGNDDSSRIY